MVDLTGYRLTFDDEFNSRSISLTGAGTTYADTRAEWRMADGRSDIGFGRSSFVDPSSGYDPFSVQNGALSITATPNPTPYGYPGNWESGLITTQGNFSQTYGYFEIRADFSNDPNAWDAFWLLPNQQSAQSSNINGHQELDVVEHYGNNDKGVYSTIHTTDPQNGIPWQDNRQVYSEMANPSGYHTYGMNWQPDKISFYVDGQFTGSQVTPSDLNRPMYLLANLAVRSDGSATGSPFTSNIDYIRVYSNSASAVAVPQGRVSPPDGYDPGLYGATAAASAAPGAAKPSLTSGTTGAPSTGAPSTGAAAVPGSTPSANPAPCYCSGTRILTEHGEVAVEDLRVGQGVVIASGQLRPIRWIGSRRYPGSTTPQADRPVRIQAGALADGAPARDLSVSPDHALYLDGLLVAAGHLVNGRTITRGEAVTDLTYWHVELDTHDMLLAEGIPAESFLPVAGLHARFESSTGRPHTDPAPAPYAERVEGGPALKALVRRLIRRAGLSLDAPGFGAIRGSLDLCEIRNGDLRVAGWAQDAAHPEGPVCLDIVVNGVVAAVTLAEVERPDLGAAAIGQGRHGFDLGLDEPLAPGVSHTVSVRRSADGAVIGAMRLDAAGAWRRAQVA
ncbi:Hint domain-containing protein [Methylobacterium sp. J-077]|uniref:Hint domain-containing protein n=1 Tax=Methylobacterium sp. J-077 TaxID=2836656 RepID=UPI001FBB005E|nr:Hint domain-containing protein [Methylobacterium sp. J-077]MCJ2124127.1 Hint domain-containing protein [Methylobacterium sp. J-077]